MDAASTSQGSPEGSEGALTPTASEQTEGHDLDASGVAATDGGAVVPAAIGNDGERPPDPEHPPIATIASGSNITRRYGQGEAAVLALDNVSVDFDAKSFNAVMGASGSGKSTLMHIMAGLDRPTSGIVTIDGRVITRMNDKQLTLLRRRRVGFVFQFFNLLPMLNAEENILLPVKIAGQKVDRDRFNAIVSAMGIGDRLKHRPAELSGGQQQRVAIARALISNPAVIFADEPTGNLDSTSAHEVLKMLRLSVDQLGQTIVMVTHEATAAAESDRIVFLKDGKIVRDQSAGSREDVLAILSELS